MGRFKGRSSSRSRPGFFWLRRSFLTRRLWLGMGLHMSWNFAQGGIFSGAVSGNDMPPGLIAPVIGELSF